METIPAPTFAKRTFVAIIESLLGEPTLRLEQFLAWTTLVVGLWILSPFWAVMPLTHGLLRSVPQDLTGCIVMGHGIIYLCVVYDSDRSRPMCAIMSLINAAIWGALLTVFLLSPPYTYISIPMAAAMTTASLLTYARPCVIRRLHHER